MTTFDSITSVSAAASETRSRPAAPLRVGVVGCGYWGPNIIRNFSGVDACRLEAVCDQDVKRLQNVCRHYPAVQAIADLAEFLKSPNIDAVAICTPVHTHYPIARAALEAGKHVLLEKPLTHSTQTARELIDTARRKGLTLMVDHTFIYSPAVQKIKSLVEDGTIGDVLYFDSVRINLGLFQHDVNVVWDLAPHDLSIMDYLLDRDPIWVSAVGGTHFGNVANLAYLTVKFDNSLIAHFHVNWLAPVKIRLTVIGGSKQMIVYDDLAPSEKIKIFDKGITVNGSTDERNRMLVDYRAGDMFAPRIDKAEPLHNVCKHFVQSVLNGTPPLTDGEAGLRVVRVLEAAQQSIEQDGARVYLDTQNAGLLPRRTDSTRNEVL